VRRSSAMCEDVHAGPGELSRRTSASTSVLHSRASDELVGALPLLGQRRHPGSPKDEWLGRIPVSSSPITTPRPNRCGSRSRPCRGGGTLRARTGPSAPLVAALDANLQLITVVPLQRHPKLPLQQRQHHQVHLDVARVLLLCLLTAAMRGCGRGPQEHTAWQAPAEEGGPRAAMAAAPSRPAPPAAARRIHGWHVR
jgi:hypothetical protein